MFAEDKQTEEFQNLTQQHEAKRFYIFSYHIFRLKDLLHCSICLEIFDSPAELSGCKHLFCKDCIEEYFEYTKTKSTCPICQKPIEKKVLIEHAFVTSIAAFVKNALQHIYLVLGQKYTKLPSYPQVLQLWQQNQHMTEVFNSIKNILQSTSVPNYSAISKIKKGVIEANVKRSGCKQVTEGLSTFDTLLQTPIQNKFFNPKLKTYSAKRQDKENTKHDYIDKVHKFEDDTNKTEILKWLENSNNKFDYKPLTQAQNITENIFDFDMPSVSQLHPYKEPALSKVPNSEVKKQKQIQSKLREKSNTLIRFTRSNLFTRNKREKEEKRARSLECCAKPITHKPTMKRHSIATCNYSLEEKIVIDQVDSQEEITFTGNAGKIALVDLMETQYLNAIDNEIISTNKSDKRKKASLQELDSKIENSLNVSRGWNRVRAAKKTFEKTEKKSSKLNVISRSTSSNIVNESHTENHVNLRPRKRIKKNLPTKIVEVSDEDQSRTFDLNEVELYFHDNLNKLVKDSSPNENVKPTTPIAKKIDAISVDTKYITPRQKVNVKHTKSKKKLTDKPTNTDVDNKVSTSTVATAENVTVPQVQADNKQKSTTTESVGNVTRKKKLKDTLPNLHKITTQAVIENKDLQETEEHSTNKIHENDQQMISPSIENKKVPKLIELQSLDVLNQSDKEAGFVVASSIGEKNTQSKQKDEILPNSLTILNKPHSKLDAIETLETSITHEESNIKTNKNRNSFNNSIVFHKPIEHESKQDNQSKIVLNLDEDDAIFGMATQLLQVPENNTINDNDLNRKLSSIRRILNLYEDNSSVVINTLICKLKDVLNEGLFPESTFQEMKNMQIQTDAHTNSVSTSTDLQEFHRTDIGIQTDSLDTSHGFRISSTDMFNIQPVLSTATETDVFVCLNCNQNACQYKPKNAKSQSVKLIESMGKKYDLSPSFDNLNFETQEILKGKQMSLKNSPNVINLDKIDIASVSKDNSLKNNSSQVSKESKSLKRIRKPSSDSDSESDKKLSNVTQKNKFDDLDLSMEFFSEQDANIGATTSIHHKKLKAISGNLDAFSEQFEAPGKEVLEEPLPKRLKTQDIIRECEMIIKEACSTTLRIEHTESVPETVKVSLDGLEDEFNRNFDEDNNNNSGRNKQEQIKSVNSNKHAKDKLSESIFSSSENKNTQRGHEVLLYNDEHNTSRKSIDDIINDFNIDDCFDNQCNQEVQFITRSLGTKKASNKGIHIIQNILLPTEIQHSTPECTVVHVKHEDAVDNASEASDEIFESDQEVIETTPQKSRPAPLDDVSILLSEAYYDRDTKINLPSPLNNGHTEPPQENPLFCLNQTFTPPPEFQDPNSEVQDYDVEIIESQKCNTNRVVSCSSLTPDLLIEDDPQVQNRDMRFITSTPFSCASQVLTVKTLNLSPIHSSGKYVNPILAAQNASKLPLTIIECDTPKKPRMIPLNTSTPKQKSILNYVKSGETSIPDIERQTLRSTQDILSQSANRKPNVCCTRMNKNELLNITSLATKKLIAFTNTFSTSVTHMIVAVDSRNCLQDHTMKYVLAVAAGIWVLNIKWIEECLKKQQIVSEEPYEALDMTGIDGPRRSRLTKSRKPLLENYKVHAAPPFVSTTQKEVENVVLLLGGEVVSTPSDLQKKDGKICLIITESQGSADDDVYEGWLDRYKVITVDLEWLSRSVGQFETLRLRPFALCSEESISNLPYPADLLEDVPYSFSHNIMN